MKKVVIRVKSKSVIIDFTNVIYVVAFKKGSLLVTLDGDEKELSCSLQKIYEDIKPLRFIRCHKSFLVNIDYIVSFNKTECTLRNGITIPKGRYYSKEFKNTLSNLVNM